MHHFRYQKNRLHCESGSLDETASRAGTTPTYANRRRESLAGLDVRISYAGKAISNRAIQGGNSPHRPRATSAICS